MKPLFAALLLVCSASSWASAQTFDNSGNNKLKGTYYFREVFWLVGDNSGALGRAISLYGNIAFDGNGTYSITGTNVYDSNAGAQQTFPTTAGTYSISASGFGYISNPLSSGDFVYGAVGTGGIFVASSTEGGFNDMFVAAPLGSNGSSTNLFQGSYNLVGFDIADGSPSSTRDTQFQLSPDGTGNIGTVRVTGTIAGRGSTTISQTITGVRYSVSNGAGVVFFGGSLTVANLIAGNKYLYISSDGNFVFGGSPTGWDMIVGVKSGGSAPAFNGLYYQAGVYQDESQLASGFSDFNTFYGAEKAASGTLLGHQRLLSVFQNNAIDYTYASNYTLGADGSYDDSLYHYIFSPGGGVRIGFGKSYEVGVNVAVQAPSFTPSSSVYIDPSGVVNAGSSSLFTSGISPGELITLYGTGLASTTVADPNFPTTLGGVQVLINNRAAPIYVVSPTQISAVVPFGTTEAVASIQVINNGVTSNTVSEFVTLTSPGLFTRPAGGIGNVAAIHADGSLVSSSSPAQQGETISVFLTGLGTVTPTVSDGAPGPTSPFSLTSNTIQVYIDGRQATTTFVGLAPGLVGLYQINVTVPSATATGSVSLDVSGPDSYNSQATLPVGSSSGVNALVPGAQALEHRGPVVSQPLLRQRSRSVLLR